MSNNNPFYQTTSQTLGTDPFAPTKWDSKAKTESNNKQEEDKNKGNFAFLYSRESDRIGSRPDLETNEPLNYDAIPVSRLIQQQKHDNEHKRTAVEVLENYKHTPKTEHPRYLTSTNDYGKKLPSEATVVTERHSKQQDFSRSFANIKPRSSTMNTSVTRSTIHSSLDPQFL